MFGLTLDVGPCSEMIRQSGIVQESGTEECTLVVCRDPFVAGHGHNEKASIKQIATIGTLFCDMRQGHGGETTRLQRVCFKSMLDHGLERVQGLAEGRDRSSIVASRHA